MRRDTQIGILLGIVILVIIGVFLSTRTTDKESILPDLAMSEKGRQKDSVDEININEFIIESDKTEPVKTLSAENTVEKFQTNEEPLKVVQTENTLIETPEENSSIEGKWEGTVGEVAEEIVEEPELSQEPTGAEDEEIAETIPTTEKVVIVPDNKPQTPTYSVPEKKIYKVMPNDNLFKIAKKQYGDGKKWAIIFDANKDSMPNSDAIYVGQKLIIPDISLKNETGNNVKASVKAKVKKEKYVSQKTHTVQSGDTLYRIAEKYYDNPSAWHKIYEANEDTIEDKGLLIKGQVLIIPKLYSN
ncbi:hypothetical protein SCALIN_C04_0255 [Candidatus Scalindua japonica]|uniref:LysM domain-containing protein n=1 Tax=Candidatus Scalindua japonica TaxID=1284222 RepID=A0A286TV36_9BACT|nr:LysM peptidoglycan-binding domain-containing protein [Candidatus Scalindua japonica]GAX59767.1 hypothetical protein SCALIN_C04_0255 [Candidatus Scalindua japonica]